MFQFMVHKGESEGYSNSLSCSCMNEREHFLAQQDRLICGSSPRFVYKVERRLHVNRCIQR